MCNWCLCVTGLCAPSLSVAEVCTYVYVAGLCGIPLFVANVYVAGLCGTSMCIIDVYVAGLCTNLCVAGVNEAGRVALVCA